MAWPVIGAALSVGGGIAGGYAQNAATREAAQFGLESTNRNIALEKWLADQEEARRKPFYDVGVAALPRLEQRRLGTFDIMSSPYASQRQNALNSGMASQQALRGGTNAGYGMNNALSGLRASEEGLGYERDLDSVRIGQGNAAQAGQQYGQFANALSGAYQNAANINSATAQSLASQRSQLYGDVMNTAAGTPAAMYLYNQRRKQQNAPTYGYGAANAAQGPTADDWRF